MLIQLTKALCITEGSILSITTLDDGGTISTSFQLKGQYQPIVVPGNWVRKLVDAKQMRAVYVDSNHFELRR